MKELLSRDSSLSCSITSTQDGSDWKIFFRDDQKDALFVAIRSLKISFIEPIAFYVGNVDYTIIQSELLEAFREEFAGIESLCLFPKTDDHPGFARHSGGGKIIFTPNKFYDDPKNVALINGTRDGNSLTINIPYFVRKPYLRT